MKLRETVSFVTTIIALGFTITALADISRVNGGIPAYGGHHESGLKHIRTQVNRTTDQWKPRDVVVINWSDGTSTTMFYIANGNWVSTTMDSEGNIIDRDGKGTKKDDDLGIGSGFDDPFGDLWGNNPKMGGGIGGSQNSFQCFGLEC